jgi:hypothetical protein
MTKIVLLLSCAVFVLEQIACESDKPAVSLDSAPSYSAAQPVDSSLYQALGKGEIVYVLEPILNEGTLRFAVDLIFQGDSSGNTTLVLPARYSGHQDFNGIKSLQAISPATVLGDTDEPNRKKLTHAPCQTVHLNYHGVQLRAGLPNLEEYLQEYNKVLRRYFTSSARFAKNSRLLADSWSNDLRLMPYHRGDIVAHNLNARIRLNTTDSSSLDEAMHKILDAAVQRGEVISGSSLYALFESYGGEDNIAELRQIITDGAPLRVAPNALGPCGNLKMRRRRKYFLFREKSEIPQYELRPLADSTCLRWFGG